MIALVDCKSCKCLILISFLIAGFLDKNRDTFSPDLIHLVSESKSQFLQELFGKERTMVRTGVRVGLKRRGRC